MEQVEHKIMETLKGRIPKIDTLIEGSHENKGIIMLNKFLIITIF